MKAPSKVAERGEKPKSLLPVPPPLLEHHGKTLFPAMAEWRERGSVPPVLLLTGLDGIGKRSLAYFVSQWILCQRSGFAPTSGSGKSEEGGLFGSEPAPAASADSSASTELAPCGECSSCQRALAGNWVDFTEIRAEEGEQLKIDQFRKLKSTLGFGAHEGPVRITLIPGADRMTTQAANSLLKLLEEPPRGWSFLLTAADPTLVLPTVLSRCQTLRLRPLSPATVRELLVSGGVAAPRASLCAALAHGSWGKALRLAADESWEKREELITFLSSPGRTLGGLVDWATSAPEHFDSLLDQLESLLGDLLRWSAARARDNSAGSWENSDASAALTRYAEGTSEGMGDSGARELWAERAERIGRARREALAPVNRKLLVQDLLLPWLNPTPSPER